MCLLHMFLDGAVRAGTAEPCTGVDSYNVLLMASLVAHVSWKLMMDSSTPMSGLQTNPLQCLSPGYAGGGIDFTFTALPFRERPCYCVPRMPI